MKLHAVDNGAPDMGADEDEAAVWTVLFVYEHPESDRINGKDTADVSLWRSIYSHLPQANWEFGRLLELNNETTLLTVQAYQGDFNVNGTTFQDDRSVWGDVLRRNDEEERLVSIDKKRLNAGFEYEGDAVGPDDDCPGLCGVDDDGDGLIDEDCNGELPWLDEDEEPTHRNTGVPNGVYGQGCGDCTLYSSCHDMMAEDDDENGLFDWVCAANDERAPGCTPTELQGVTGLLNDPDGGQGTDPRGDINSDACPGECGVDDDGDGLIDEDSNGYMSYLRISVAGQVACTNCQSFLVAPEGDIPDGCPVVEGKLPPGSQSHEPYGPNPCPNPLYWEDYDSTPSMPRDRTLESDDDEDGLVDEDGGQDPLLVHLRAIPASDACSSGRQPYLPVDATIEPPGEFSSSVPLTESCLAPQDAQDDPWVYQVQYVYARTNPYWLLNGRNGDDKPDWKTQPKYYYFPPFDRDINRNGRLKDLLYDEDGDGAYDEGTDLDEEHLETLDDENSPFDGMVVDSSGADDVADGRPNVHPDCVPDPDFRGPQGQVAGKEVAPSEPSDVHLIKKVVRMRGDAASDPSDYVERVWLYRYNDLGFLKAVFDPASVEGLIADSDEIDEADDILQLSDSHLVNGRPLIFYASSWYTYYNPYVYKWTEWPPTRGIPPCYDDAPFVGEDCQRDSPDDPSAYLPINACDGTFPWSQDYSKFEDELYVDPDCSPFMKQQCGWCFARLACTAINRGYCTEEADTYCDCDNSPAISENQLAQMGIAGAQPRFRKYLVKTARVRRPDGQMKLYRFDYLGAANSVYADESRLTYYADPHNITIVDEIVLQTEAEYDHPGDFAYRNEFYVYEDDFKITLDGNPPSSLVVPPQPGDPQYEALPLVEVDTHFLHAPAKVKTRRVVTMNYYGIAISDRLIVTPGFLGDVTALVDDERYELTNTRGQTKLTYDQSWLALFRDSQDPEGGVILDAIKEAGRSFVELFGGDGGWYSVLRGVAWGSGGGNLYDQQCRTPEVLEDVPIQRVQPEQVRVTEFTKHYERLANGVEGDPVKDMPALQATYYRTIRGRGPGPVVPNRVLFSSDLDDGPDVHDPAGTIGDLSEIGDGTGCLISPCDGCQCAIPGQCTPEECAACDCALENGQCTDWLAGINLKNQDPVEVNSMPVPDDAGEGKENDGVSEIRHAYLFRDEGTGEGHQRRVRWKWRWLEEVSADRGGADQFALELWFFNENGQLCLYGRGSGVEYSDPDKPPLPAEPFFFWTYFGYNEFGQLEVQVDDFDPAKLSTAQEALRWVGELGDIEEGVEEFYDGDPNVELFTRKPLTGAQNYTTRFRFDNLGMIVSKREGFSLDDTGAPDDNFDPGLDEFDEFTRTDYDVIANRTIYLIEGTPEKRIPIWRDPYT